jgi:hypothetical protein
MSHRRSHPPLWAPLWRPAISDCLRPCCHRHKIHPNSTMLPDIRAGALHHLFALPPVVLLRLRVPPCRAPYGESLPPQTPQTGSPPHHRPLAAIPTGLTAGMLTTADRRFPDVVGRELPYFGQMDYQPRSGQPMGWARPKSINLVAHEHSSNSHLPFELIWISKQDSNL